MINKMYRLLPVAFLFVVLLITGCAGTQPFNHIARAGDTIAIAAGWKHEFSRDKLTVTITPSVGSDITYLPNDQAVRASVNFYADPASYMAVGYEVGLGQAAYNYANTYGQVVTGGYTNNEPDWWQTVVFVDLPASLPQGTTNVSLVSSGGLGESWSVPVEIVAGTGEPHPFAGQNLGPMTEPQLHTLERAPNFEVQFSGGGSPHAIQIDLTHDVGVGKTYVINPRGDVKSVNWTDDGQNLRVLLNFSRENPLRTNIERFKFYVSGGVTGLNVQNIQAFDVNGNSVSGVVANITNHF